MGEAMTKSLDSETTGLTLLKRDRPFMFSAFNDADESARIWSWSVDPMTRKPQYRQQDLDELADYMWGEDLVFHNAVFDLRALGTIGFVIHFEWPIKMVFDYPTKLVTKRHVKAKALHDTQLLSHSAYSPGASGNHDLKSLALHYLDYTPDDERRLHSDTVAARRIGKKLGWSLGVNHKGTGEVQADYWLPRACWERDQELGSSHDEYLDVPDSWATVCQDYALGDVERTLALYHFLQEILQSEGLEKNYERELRLLPVTYRMENAGMPVSKKRLAEELGRFESMATNLKAKATEHIRVLSGKTINVNSGDQLGEWLYDSNLQPVHFTPTNKPSTKAPHLLGLAQYAESHGYPELVAKALRCIVGFSEDAGDDKTSPGYTTYESAVSYLRSYQQLLIGSRLHPSYHQSGTKFTRYSCSKPNGQNVSKKAVIPLRRVFGPEPGHLWLDPDYSQLELRIFAYAAQDHKMIEAFEKGYDFHEFTACTMYNLDPASVSKEQRRFAKATNFKAIYGGLNNVPPIYREQFPAAAAFMAKCSQQVYEKGYVNTLQGDRIYIDSDKAYVSVDAICQGTAGRIVKEAMRMIHEMEIVDWQGSLMIGNIHDQIIFDIVKTYPVRAIARRIKQVMESAGTQCGVVTPIDMTVILESWDEPTAFNLDPSPRRKVA